MSIKSLVRRSAIASTLLAAVVAVNTAGAQSVAGRWEGVLYAQGQSIPVTITIDSAAAGWSGTLHIPQMLPNPIPMTVSIKKDTVSMQLPDEGMNAFIQGLLSADRTTLNGMVAVQGDNSGTFQVKKAAATASAAPAPAPAKSTPAKPPAPVGLHK